MIEKMKFLSITGPKADIDRMTETYLSRYEIHLENALAELTEVANLSPFLEINPYKDHLNVIDSFYEQLETPEKAVISDMTVETALKTVQNLRNKAQELDAEKSRLQSEHAEMVDSLKIIRPFRNLDFDVSQILNFKYIHYRFGRIEKQYLQKFEKYIYDNLDTLFIKCGEDELYTYGVYFVPEHQAHKVHAVYSSMHFERIFIPDEYHGTAAEAFEKLDRRHREIHAGLDANKAAYRKFLEDSSSAIVSAKAALESCSRSFDIRKLAACTHGDTNTFYILCGWMTEKDALAFQKDIQNDEKIFCLMEDQQAPAKKKPPTKLKNPKLFKPFEMYVKMYGLPAYNEMDPTWFVAIFLHFRSYVRRCRSGTDSFPRRSVPLQNQTYGSCRNHQLRRCIFRIFRFHVRQLLRFRGCPESHMAETYEPDDGRTACRKTEYSFCYRHRFRNVYHSDLYDIQYHQFHPKQRYRKGLV